MLTHTLSEPTPGAPVVLYLHGLGIAGWCWQPTIDALPDAGALVPDLPGHGRSVDVPWRSLSDTAKRVCDVVDQVPADVPLVLAGHSLGAYVGMGVLAHRPDRFAGACLSGFHLSAPGRPLLLKLAYVINGLVFRVPALMRRFASVFGDAAFADRFIQEARTIRSRTIRRAGIQVVDFQVPDGIDAVKLPILAIAGGAEPAAIRRAPSELAQRLARVDAVVLDGRDHLWPVKEPALYAGKLENLLRTVSRQDAN